MQYTDCIFIWFLIWHVGLCGPASEYIRRVPCTYRFSVSIVEQSIYEKDMGTDSDMFQYLQDSLRIRLHHQQEATRAQVQ